jgi:hypothetical protein
MSKILAVIKQHYLIIIIVIILTITGTILLLFKQKQAQKYPETTGAVLEIPDPQTQQIIKNFYQLLTERPHEEKNKFIFRPQPKTRKIEIYLFSPYEENKNKANEWLVQKGYKNIPAKNFVWIQM